MNLTDDEIRVKVAELMGCKWIKSGKYRIPTFDPVIAPECYQAEEMADGSEPIGNLASKLANIPNYSTSVDAALTLCDRLRGGDMDILVTIEKAGFTVNVYIGQMALVEIEDQSLARAICLAFLKVKDSVASSP